MKQRERERSSRRGAEMEDRGDPLLSKLTFPHAFLSEANHPYPQPENMSVRSCFFFLETGGDVGHRWVRRAPQRGELSSRVFSGRLER